jgi:Tfp pilus assembly protein PilF
MREAAQTHFDMGLGHLEDQRFPEAISEFQKAQEQDPNNPQIGLHLGIAELQAGHIKSAREHMEKACSEKSPYPECWNNLAYLELQAKRPKVAIQHAQKALETVTYSTPELALGNLAKGHIELKQFAQARPAIERALKISPENCNLRLIENLYFARQKNWKETLHRASRTSQICRSTPESYFWEAYAYAKLGKSDLARRKCGDVLEMFRNAVILDKGRACLEKLDAGRTPDEPGA